MSIRSFFVSATAVAALAGSTFANPLNLVPGNPDVASGFILVTYNASTHAFSATGYTQNIALPGGTQEPANLREFTLTATISNSGVASDGTLMVRTDHTSADSVGFSSASLVSFGFDITNKFEFVFSQAAGNLASAGTQIGTILVAPDLFSNGMPSFAADFSNDIGGGFGVGNADTFALVPAPASLALCGVAGLVAGRRRRA
jgi:hypothetical protein